jgi:hypothetical protein
MRLLPSRAFAARADVSTQLGAITTPSASPGPIATDGAYFVASSTYSASLRSDRMRMAAAGIEAAARASKRSAFMGQF